MGVFHVVGYSLDSYFVEFPEIKTKSYTINMKVIGKEVDGARANFIGLESHLGNVSQDYTIPKFLELGNDKDFVEVRRFRDIVHNLFSAFSPDIIGIYFKPSTGKFPAGPLTYKIEGLIQLYEGKNMQFVDPRSIAALKKKKEYEVTRQFAYQQKAADVAYYLINNDE